jgi:hypothetical protein
MEKPEIEFKDNRLLANSPICGQILNISSDLEDENDYHRHSNKEDEEDDYDTYGKGIVQATTDPAD